MEKVPSVANAVILVGSPTTNSAVAKALGSDAWPKLTDQGLALKHASLEGKPTLVVGGGTTTR